MPPARVYTGFIKSLKKHKKEIEKIKEELIKFMYDNLKDFGKDCAVDGKYLDSYGNQFYKNKTDDNRGEHEATSSCKTYYMKDGTTKKEWHYGYRAHIICDAKYGLPIKSKVTPASNSEQTELDNMIKEMATGEEKYKLEKMENLMGDAGYDNGARNKNIKEGRATRQNIQKQVVKVQKLNQRLVNIRTDYINKIVFSIIKQKPSYITIEDLAVSNLMKNKHLSKAIASQKFFEFKTKLMSKCKENNIELRIVDRFYPSSKTCSQ